MKKIYLLALSLFLIPLLATAQHSAYTYQPGYWTVGINGGLSYQSSDVKALLEGYGLGATIAKNIFYQPGAPISFDLRGRALYTRSYGLDVTRNFDIENNSVLNGAQNLDYTSFPANLEEPRGFVFQNHKTDIGELSLEGVLTLNQLKEKTGVIASIYGGVGVDWYRTAVDQADANGNEYFEAYANIDASKSSANIRKELQNLVLDGNYESLADGFDNNAGKIGIMPSLGLELGYQLTPKFSIHAGHRMTFAGNNILDGQQWSDNGNDAYHYTNFGMRWIIEQEKPRQAGPNIQITTPTHSPYNTRDPNGIVRANISNVNSPMDVTCRVNGRAHQFSFNNGRFSTDFRLNPGRNDVLITAKNNAGQDSKSTIIIFQDAIIDQPPPPPVVYAPTVRLTSPSNRTSTVNEAPYTVRARIENIKNKNDILFTQNGYGKNFNFDSRTGNFTAEIYLEEGENEIFIEASNRRGKASDEAYIRLESSIDQPIVYITDPNRERTTTSNSRVSVKADVKYVEDKNDVTVRVNGNSTRRFDFYPDRSYLRIDVDLLEGSNSIEIIAENKGGDASDIVYITYEEERQVELPLVEITNPDRETMSTTKNDITIEANIENVINKNDITFTLNGQKIYNFSFNRNTGRLTKNINLVDGENRVIINAKNQDGSDEDRVSIRRIGDISRKNPPVVDILSPANNSSTQNQKINLRARIEKVTSRNTIRLYLNGNTVSNFDFNYQSKELKANLTLTEGNNTIRIRATNIDGSDEDQINVQYKKQAAPTVFIERPKNNATVDKNTTVLVAETENIDSKSEVSVRLNGNAFTNFRFDRNKQEINATVPLKEGSNTILIRVNNNGGTDQATTRVRYTKANPPVVQISKPANNSQVQNSRINLNATVKNVENKSGITLTINGKPFTAFSFNASTDILTANLTLIEGNNSIRVKARNNDGTDEASVNVQYKKAVVSPPSVRITAPSNANHTTSESIYTVKAIVRGVVSKSDITLTVNGKANNSFSYNSTGNLNLRLNLKEGNNTVIIKAKNAGGTAEDRATIKRTVTKKPPIVQITSPKPGTKVTKKSITIRGTIKNVANKADVSFKVNGKSVSSFNFSSQTFSATYNNLRPGNNTFDLSARNSDGSDSESVTVNYQPRVDLSKPIVNFVKPSKAGTVITTPKTTIVANVKNVLAKKGLTFWINGVKNTSFEYNSKLKQITANVSLKRGNNTFKVEGKNEAGTASAETAIEYKISRKQLPNIEIKSISQPTTNPFEPNVGRSTIIATITNVASKNNISLLVNGKKIANFTYTPKTKQFRATVNLIRGENTIKLIATNQAGKDEETRTIEY